jgi:hypothetical protein
VVRETLRTGGKIQTDIAENKSPELSPKDIVSKHVTESVQNLIGNLRGGGRKRNRGVSRTKAKRALLKKGTYTQDFPQSLFNMSDVTSTSSQFDIFMHRPIQTAVQGTVETVYKPVSPVEKNDLEFLIPGDSDTYFDLDIKLYVRGKMVSSSGKDVDLTDTTAVANNLLHTLFSQCTLMVNGVPVTQ